ncbi:MAG: hypothetical protein M1830_010507 [Pleopsidium flavum]|nr:MAG: hypothetical protein M1830_010507 [Pleopsidium flavum]
MSPSSTRPTSLFTRLPLEIRQQVYEEVLSESPCKGVHLLRVCIQIYSEAQQYLFRLPLIFRSQNELLRWVDFVDQEYLRHVTTIQLRLLDLGPDEVVRTLGRRLRLARVDSRSNSPTTSPYAEACDRQIQEIEYALEKVPNVHDFTILQQRSSEPGPCQYMQTSFLYLIGRIYPHLRTLTIFVTKMSLTPLESLQNLRSLRFCGWSTSTPSETSRVLQKLTRLVDIEVFGPPLDLEFDQRPGYTGPLRVQSLTTESLKNIHQLKSLAIWDIRDEFFDDASDDAVFLNDDIFDVLSTHQSSLRTLKLSTTGRPWIAFQKLSAFLATSPLMHLECSWRSVDVRFVGILPRSLTTLSISAPSFEKAKIDLLVDKIVERRSELVLLSRVTIRTGPAYQTKFEAKFEEYMARMCQRLKDEGILGIWEGVSDPFGQPG